MADLANNFGLQPSALGHLTSAVQFGFISGTLTFALLTLADRYPPSKVFLVSACFGAIFNLGMIFEGNTLFSLFGFRFLTGFFLAGIYPVGMKIAADYYQKGLGKSLGFLVGALVLGTAFPHLLKAFSHSLNWSFVLITTSLLAFSGGVILYLTVPDGPYRRPGQRLDLLAFLRVFRDRQFRSAAFGYFGHMWELYAFWTFTPLIVKTYIDLHPGSNLNIPLLSFLIIGIGGLACILGGYISQGLGTKRTAFISLLLSGSLCLLSPLLFMIDAQFVFVSILLIWGMVVIADSPLFSTLVAQNALAEVKGTALTIVNCIGFSITIVSIQLINSLQAVANPTYLYLFLAVGPAFGLAALVNRNNSHP